MLNTWYLTPLLAMLITWYLTLLLDIWHRYLSCLSLDIDTSTCHAILNTWYLTPVLAMLYLTPDTWHLIYDSWRLTCYHLVLAHLTWYCDTWLILLHLTLVLHGILMIITFMGTWHDIILLPDIWYSWTPVLLNSCIPEPLKKGDSWYYAHVDPRNWITMNIELLWTPCGHYHWTNSNN